ncbi:MAG: AMP-binding protein [Candidatus Lokiarchaeota archaeon]|nr:AMP-binding protein [Candidatus Lokiarchaeota archaeon]
MEIPRWYVDDSKPWFKKYQEGVPKHPEFPVISLGDWFDQKTEEFAKNKCIYFSKTFMNYRVLRKYTDSLATSLSRQGVKKGDVIAILLPNCFQFTISYFATVKLGGIVIPINPTYKPLEILHVLEQVKPKGLVCMDVMYGLIKPIQDKYKFDFVISTCIVDLAAIPPAVKEQLIADGTIPKGEVPGALNFSDVCQKRGEVDIPEVEIDPLNDTAVYLMTGGTTGVPKPAIITHYNCVTNAKQNVMWMPDASHPMACIGILPMFHAFGMTIVQNVVIEGGDYNILFAKRELELKEVVDTIVEVGPPGGVILPGVENLFIGLTRYLKANPEPKLEKMFRLCVSGAGPLHKPVKDAFEAIGGGRLVEAYGLTECTTAVSVGPFNGTDTAGTIGLPLPGVEWAIFDSEDFSMGQLKGYGIDFTGEICVCGPQVMKGYLNRPEATAEVLKEWEGRTWCLTGDIGYMDEHGQMVIRDRKKQMIKYKGYSVFPKEVEDLLGSHPDVMEVAVAGLPDVETGEIVKAWVQLQDDSVGKISSEELITWSKENITHYKCPKQIEIIDEIPKSMVGKVQRRQLQIEDPLWKARYGATQ